MRQFFFIIATLFLCSVSFAQSLELIRQDPSMIWAEGRGYSLAEAEENALEGLVQKLSQTEALPLDASVRIAIWQTYLSDIRKCSYSANDSGSVIRYMERSRIRDVFSSRWQKVRELCNQADQSYDRGDIKTARTYCSWAEIYVRTLPAGETALRIRLSDLQKMIGSGELATVRLRNIETEIEAIRLAFAAGEVKEAMTTVTSVYENHDEKAVSVQAQPSSRPASPEIPSGPDIVTGTEVIIPSPSLLYAPKRIASIVLPEPVEEVKWTWSVYAMTELSRYPAAGLMFSGSYGRWGGYASFRSNFTSKNSSYSCNSDGSTDFGYIWATGNSLYSRLAYTAGATYSIIPALKVFAGAGYGRASICWEDTNANWALVEDLTSAGFAPECGLTWQGGHFSILIGYSLTGLRHHSALFGLGWAF